MKLSHIDHQGDVRMVDTGSKKITRRIASASCEVFMKKSTLKRILEEQMPKGHVFTIAKTAGIIASKKVFELIPMCHQIPLENVELSFDCDLEKGSISITSEVSVTAKTGVEMEALQAVVQAALTIYDMCKAVDKEIIISDIKLIKKSGGKSGTWIRK